ncbi:hypothetical protein QQ045_030847 [Rhodiola kirilowii]
MASSSDQTILVTGGAGFIGSHTMVQLLNAGYMVCVVDNLDNSSMEAVDSVREVEGPLLSQKLWFHLVDLRNKVELDKLFAKNKFDAVIHFARLKAVGESVAKPQLYYENNVVGTLNLYDVMTRYKCKKFVGSSVFDFQRMAFESRWSSSATVYGQPEKVPCDENSKLMATNPYGRTKQVAVGRLPELNVFGNDPSSLVLSHRP